ncbi:MAG: Polyhydroxyalkanoic acid synthase [uncultured Caballeronia sp.]|nr:MAG: Polyhydroxyalkanoic acid synthase [uncultured Caballeronia sp.]
MFIDDSEVYFIESMMWSKGYLEVSQMSGAFQMLESNDLVWSHLVRDYILGERAPMFDLMAWNADSTRMPYRMHSGYLRRLFLDNDLAANRYQVDGRPISLRNIRAPMFVVGTDRDHIAPWRSVYKIHYLSGADMTFVLTSGGHNAGIDSEPGHSNRQFRIKYSAPADLRVGPDRKAGHGGTHGPVGSLPSRPRRPPLRPPHMGPHAKPPTALPDAMCSRTRSQAMEDNLLRNCTFDELAISESASLVRTAGLDDIQLFAANSGDVNPAHVDAAFAAKDMFGHVVVQGMWTAGLISALLGTRLPGPGTIYLDQDLQFRHPVVPGDVVTATVSVKEKHSDKRIVLLDTRCTNQRGETVLIGVATAIVPAERIVWPRIARPDVVVRNHDRYDAFMREARSLPSLRTAVVHPCSAEAIRTAIEACDEGTIDPVLIGPEAKIRAAAELAQVSLDRVMIEAVEHSHAAAARAVELGAAGRMPC